MKRRNLTNMKRKQRVSTRVSPRTEQSTGVFASGPRTINRLFPGLNRTLIFEDVVPVTTLTSDLRYLGNGLYDPRYDLGGGQPSYFNAMMQVYSRYHVDSVTVEVSFKSTAVDTLWGLVPTNSNDTSSINSFDAILELPGSTWARTTDGANPTTLVRTYNTSRVEGVPTIASYLDYSGNRTSNPVNGWLVHVIARATDGVTNLNGRFVIRLLYHTHFFGTTNIDS